MRTHSLPHEPCRLLQHPSAAVTFNPPPCPPEAVAAAKRDAAAQRAELGISDSGIEVSPIALARMEATREAEWERLAVVEGLSALVRSFGGQTVLNYVRGEHRHDWQGLGYLVQTYGQERVERYVRNIAALHGEGVI